MNTHSDFARRHIGPRGKNAREMLDSLGYQTLDELIADIVPADIRMQDSLDLPAAKSETEALEELRSILRKNKLLKTFIGQGYYGTITPSVILRNVLENPGWYTAYTPYQPEIAQGRLEMLMNFQTMVSSLTGLPVANASLLDEGTAARGSRHHVPERAPQGKHLLCGGHLPPPDHQRHPHPRRLPGRQHPGGGLDLL